VGAVVVGDIKTTCASLNKNTQVGILFCVPAPQTILPHSGLRFFLFLTTFPLCFSPLASKVEIVFSDQNKFTLMVDTFQTN